MYTSTRFFWPNGIEGESMDNTVKEFDDVDKAIKYAHRYAKGVRFAGVQIEDENGKLLYEITDSGDVFDYSESSKEVNQEQLKVMKHMLGLDYKKKPYRNYFYSHYIQDDIEDLIKKDLAFSRDASNGRDIVYYLSKKGVEFTLNKAITDKEYEEL